MITTLALALVLAQDPKPAAKTVEDRVKELTDRIEALDKKAVALAAENALLQLKVQEAQLARETFARQTATAWVKRYVAAVDLTEKQSAELEDLWFGWSKQDFEKACDVAGWKSREESLRSKLTAEQGTKLARKVREEQEQNARTMLKQLVQIAKLPSGADSEMEKIVLPKLPSEETTLLPAAHPENVASWAKITGIVEAGLPELPWSDEEKAGLRKLLNQWKPRSR